jgi:uncharacterized protein DUF4337
MSGATELLEQMEHAGHAGHGGEHGHGGGDKSSGRAIGITMALLGVMLAFCAAMVGSERTELISTMVEQANKWGIYQSETTKFRVITGDMEILSALVPSKAEEDQLDATLRSKRSASGKTDDEDTAEIKDLVASSLDDLADLLTPDQNDIKHFQHLAKVYENDVKEAKEDAEAYELSVKAHQRAAELYERAQLSAEIGIVIASVALLLASKKVWYIALVCGTIGASTIAYTAVTTHQLTGAAEDAIAEAAKRETVMETDEDTDGTPEAKPADSAKAADSAKPADKAAPKKE